MTHFIRMRQGIHRLFTSACARRHLSSCSTYTSVPTIPNGFQISEEVLTVLQECKVGVVALESTLITHGLPHPTNYKVALSLEEHVRAEGAMPATIAIMDGRIKVGLTPLELEELADTNTSGSGGDHQPNQRMKVSIRDISTCMSRRVIGGTTVASTLWIANRVGIGLFATGGIGGVHRGAEKSFDISADLIQLGRTPVAVVCAGAKSILDVGKTLEVLETQGTNVIVYGRSNSFPGFFTPQSGHKAPHHTQSLEEIARILEEGHRLGIQSGILIACPVPEEFAGDAQLIEDAIQKALAETNQEERGIVGREVTPYVLRRVSELTGSASMTINIALLENNARIAGKLAALMSSPTPTPTNTATSVPINGERAPPPQHQPTVLCIGAAIVDFEVVAETDEGLVIDSETHQGDVSYYPGRIHQRCGGVARNHAEALTRLGINAPFISILGRDSYADFLREKCPQMDWSPSFFTSSGIPTSNSMTLSAPGGRALRGFIDVDAAMEELTPQMIALREELFAASDYVLLDANLSDAAMGAAIHMAQKHGSKGSHYKVHKIFADGLYSHVDVISPSSQEFKVLCNRHLGLALPDEIFSSASRLADYLDGNTDSLTRIFGGHLQVLLVTVDKTGSLIVNATEDGDFVVSRVSVPDIDQAEVVSVSGAGDCYNCGFLAARLHQLSLERSIEVAKECALRSLLSIEAVPSTLNPSIIKGSST